MHKNKIVASFLSRINVNTFSRFVESVPLLRLPYKVISQRLIDPRFPQHIFLESTNACNLKCCVCPRTTSSRDIGCMDFFLFKKIVDEASVFGSRSFCLHIFGEPLLAPDLIKMIKYIKDKDGKNVILLTTNGVLLTQELSNKIIESGVDRLIVSVLAANDRTYKSLTQLDYLKKVEDNVENFLSLKRQKRKNKPIVYVRMLKNENTNDEVKLFITKWSARNVMIDIREAHNYAGKVATNTFKKKTTRRYPCYHLWFSPAVNFDGEVSICCCDWKREAVLGDVRKNTLSDIWQSGLIKKYRRFHLEGDYSKIPLCARCDVWATYPDIFFEFQKRKE